MTHGVFIRTYKAPPFCEREIFRYAGGDTANDETAALVRSCIEEARSSLVYKVCFCELSVHIEGKRCKFGAFELHSDDLAKNLQGCKSVILFAATIGTGIDRLIARYGRISPARGLIMQALGAERIEALCDLFCGDIAQEKHIALKPRFSPGYGDLPLDVQRDIFALLDCPRHIGLSLGDSLLMSPSKSVTAFAGISDRTDAYEHDRTEKCRVCPNQDCSFRSIS